MIKERNIILDELKNNLRKVQEKMKKFANRKRNEVQYDVGDRVFLKIQTIWFSVSNCQTQ